MERKRLWAAIRQLRGEQFDIWRPVSWQGSFLSSENPPHEQAYEQVRLIFLSRGAADTLDGLQAVDSSSMPVIDLDARDRQTLLSVDDALTAAGEFKRGQQLQLLLVSGPALNLHKAAPRALVLIRDSA